jgi:hypothetical protein
LSGQWSGPIRASLRESNRCFQGKADQSDFA